MHLEPEQEALPALLSHTLEIIETAQVLLCVTQKTFFDPGLCLMEIFGHTAGTLAQEDWNSFPVVNPFFLLTVPVKKEESEISLSTTRMKLEISSLNQWLYWWYLEHFLH